MNTNGKFVCSCLKNYKLPHVLMCEDCLANYDLYVKKMFTLEQVPKSRFQYTKDMASVNIDKTVKRLNELKNSTTTFWDQAYKEVRQETRKMIDKKDFLSKVKEKYNDLLRRAGLERVSREIEISQKQMNNLKRQIDWLAGIKKQKQARAKNVFVQVA